MDIAFSSIDEIERLQEKSLRAHIAYCRKNSPYYQRVLGDVDIDAKKGTADILAELPFTDKSDIEKFNDELCAVHLIGLLT